MEQHIDERSLHNVEELNAGRIDWKEFQRRAYKLDKEKFLPKLLEHRQRKDWQAFIALALSVYQIMPEAFSFFDEVPDSMKYQFAIEAYIHHGDSIPAVRRAVRKAARYGKATLPAEIAKAETVTIYRAGEEPIEKAKYRISWTTDYAVADFFLNRYAKRHANQLYRGTIRTRDIIAYCDDRDEREVMQYGKVFDVTDITPPAKNPN